MLADTPGEEETFPHNLPPNRKVALSLRFLMAAVYHLLLDRLIQSAFGGKRRREKRAETPVSITLHLGGCGCLLPASEDDDILQLLSLV